MAVRYSEAPENVLYMSAVALPQGVPMAGCDVPSGETSIVKPQKRRDAGSIRCEVVQSVEP